MINPFPKLIDEKYLSRAKELSVALLCDGMKELDIPKSGCMCSAMGPLDPSMKVVGTAVTVETCEGDNLPIHFATYAAENEGYVMVIDGRGYAERAYVGDLIMGAAQAVGYSAIVVDGFVRDRDGAIELNFPTFSRGLVPAGPVKKNPGRINVPIVCGGVDVHPGDLIAGDYDGVCVIPNARIAEVLEKAGEKLIYEEKRRKAIQAYIDAKAAKLPLPQLAPQWVLDILNK